MWKGPQWEVSIYLRSQASFSPSTHNHCDYLCCVLLEIVYAFTDIYLKKYAHSLEPVLRNKRGRDSERPAHRDEEWPPLATARESPRVETKIQHSQKEINWAIGIDMYTLMCIKLMPNKNLQYKKTNKTTNTKLALGYLYGNMLI